MLYILALFSPPLAVLIAGGPAKAILNIFLCLLLIIPGIIHAFKVVGNYYADRN